MALQDTLNKLQQDQAAIEESERNKPKLIEEWQNSVAELYRQINGFLEAYSKQISLRVRETLLNEELVGQYSINELQIVAGPAVVWVKPRARFVIAAEGIVEITREGRPAASVSLVRTRRAPDQPPIWVIPAIERPVVVMTRGRPVAQRSRPKFEPLTKARFEQELERLLK